MSGPAQITATERPSAMSPQNFSAHSMLYLVGRPILAGTCVDRSLVRVGIFALRSSTLIAMRGARALVRFLAFSISARSTGLGGGRFASLSANACSSAARRSAAVLSATGAWVGSSLAYSLATSITPCTQIISTCGAFVRLYRQVGRLMTWPLQLLWLLAKRRPQTGRLSNPV